MKRGSKEKAATTAREDGENARRARVCIAYEQQQQQQQSSVASRSDTQQCRDFVAFNTQ